MYTFNNLQVIETTFVNDLAEISVDINDLSKRPWFMKGGKERPLPALKSQHTGRRLARLWPEEDPYDDRITNQVIRTFF